MSRTAARSPTKSLACKDHPGVPSVQRCASCGRGLCDTCFRFTIDRKPSCARCAYEASTRPQRRVSLAVVFLCIATALWVWLARKYDLWPDSPFLLGFGGVGTLAVTALISASARDTKRGVVEGRDDEEVQESADAVQAHPYRAQARQVLLAVSPRVSGKATAAVVLASLVAAAVLVPASLRLPRWVEMEIVLVAWWLTMALTIVVLLDRGFRLRDDFVVFLPWDRPTPTSGHADAKKSTWSLGDSWGTADGCSSIDGEGCVGALIIVVVLGAAIGAAWLVVEIALPIVFFVLYALLMRAIRRAATDRRGCAGELAKSVGWGSLWATIYVVPIAALTWLVHRLHH